MDARRLGTRGLANLAYAYLSSRYVAQRVAEAADRVQTSTQGKRSLTDQERRQAAQEAQRLFDEELVTELPVAPGIDPERVAQARSNMMALGALMADLARANAEPV